jgi:hypothetical protein
MEIEAELSPSSKAEGHGLAVCKEKEYLSSASKSRYTQDIACVTACTRGVSFFHLVMAKNK